VAGSLGKTPMISRRLDLFARVTEKFPWRHDLECDSHIVTGSRWRGRILRGSSEPAGSAFILRNAGALPRARLVGRPSYAEDQRQAALELTRLGAQLRDHLVVEDPSHPLAGDAAVTGTARIVEDLPERVVIQTEAAMPAYLVLADTFDPGWSATVDDHPALIRPAYVAFRAVFLPQGKHTVVFTYRPAGFEPGLRLTLFGIAVGLMLWWRPRRAVALAPDHIPLSWPRAWRTVWFVSLGLVVLASAISIGPDGKVSFHRRWAGSLHTHTWGSGVEAMKVNRM
jgi:hypothetical protein